MFDVERGSIYEVRAVEADLGVHLRGVSGPAYGYDQALFRLADDQPAHPWASELRKYNLVDTELDGTELEGHPFRVVDGLIRAITTEGERGPGDDVDWACNEIEEGYTPTEALC
ncbi:MAG: hypothetical protein ACK53W_06070 [Gemmatimonadota bacterium]